MGELEAGDLNAFLKVLQVILSVVFGNHCSVMK